MRPSRQKGDLVRLVILESPYAARPPYSIQDHEAYARACIRDSLARNEAPIASHLLYTQVLNDSDPDERALGIRAGLAWLRGADAMVVYEDLGISSGMLAAINRASDFAMRVEHRQIGWPK